MESFNHKSIFSKLTKLFFIFGVFLVIIAALVMYYLQAKLDQYEVSQKSQLVLKYKQHTYVEYIQNAKKLLQSINHSSFFYDFLEDKKNQKELEELFYTLAQTNSTILQIRYLDTNGKELIRVNQESKEGVVYKVPQNLLQHKEKRYYYDEIKSMQQGQVYISKLDLNVENGQIEVPYVPTVRLGLSVYKESAIVGLLIVNLQMENILQKTVNSDIFHVYITDRNSDIIYSNDESKNNWASTLNVYSKVNSEDIIEKEKLFITKDQELNIILKQKNVSNKTIINNTILGVVTILLIASLVFIYLLRGSMKVVLNKFNEQNRYVIQQIKLESIGKLLENLAHQWRQPLNVISSLSSSSKMMIQMDLLKPNEIYDNLDQITSTCIGLSHTIDDFKNFFKIDANITSFKLLELKEGAQAQLHEQLQKSSITLVTDKQSVNLKMKGSKNALVQVLVVLLRNAIDAHLKNNLKERYVFFSAKATKENITLIVKDNALGISEDVIDKIFEPYFTTKHQSVGKGMGLYIVHQIITQQLNGHIEVQNVKFRHNHISCEGAEFHIILPLKQ